MQTGEMPRYERYIDSGADWADELPSEWAVEKAKWLFLRAERAIQPYDGIVTCFRDGQVTLRSNRRTDGFTNALKEHGYQRIHEGDLVIHAMDAFAGAIGVSDSTGKSTPVYSACVERTPNTVNQYFYAYYLRSLAQSGYLESLAKGIRERSTDFRFTDFAKLVLAFPPLDTQNAIVRFLDETTAKIDDAIAIRGRQIAQLKERKQIITQNAVTIGLSPSVAMKDSGVEWIGRIPAHWGVKRLKYVAKLNTHSLPEDTDKYFSFRYVDISNVSLENGVEFAQQMNFADAPSRARRLANAGDTVVSTVRTYLKAIAYVDDEKCDYVYSTGFSVIHPNDEIFPEFLTAFLTSNSFTNQVDVKSKGVSYPAINSTDLGDLFVTLPPLTEMKSIAGYLDAVSRSVSKALSLKASQIEKLREYKETLIKSVVTGKIKVV